MSCHNCSVLVWGQGMNPNIEYDIHKYWVGRIIEFATKVEDDDEDEVCTFLPLVL